MKCSSPGDGEERHAEVLAQRDAVAGACCRHRLNGRAGLRCERAPPVGPDWLHEVKFDGYRMVSVIDQGRVRVHTKRGLDWTSRMPGIAPADPSPLRNN